MNVPDQEFANPQLVQLYDHLGANRNDLDYYIAMVDEFNARSVLDFGCGTGEMLSKLFNRKLKLFGVEPAEASLDIARSKKGASEVRWILGGADATTGINADLAFMTGNVAQVFLADKDWLHTLKTLHSVLSPSGYLIFETRNPKEQAWMEWTREKTVKVIDAKKFGPVVTWCEVTDVSLPNVSFKWTYVFRKTGDKLLSKSTLRFRDKDEIERSLKAAGFELQEVRDAPDRPGKEFVFIARAKFNCSLMSM